MGDETTDATTQGMSRRTVLAGAAWTLPVVAVAVATPGASASGGGEPTAIGTTLQPDPPQANQPLRLTFQATDGFVFVPFPAGSTAIVSISGAFSGTTFSGATITGQTGTDPVTYNLAITDLNGFYVEGTGEVGSSVSVSVFDNESVEIGSDFIQIGLVP